MTWERRISWPQRRVADLLPLHTLVGEAWGDYGLIDSGGGRKLERYGRYRFIRPEPQAMWTPALPVSDWDQADGDFNPASDEDGGGDRKSTSLHSRHKCAHRMPSSA